MDLQKLIHSLKTKFRVHSKKSSMNKTILNFQKDLSRGRLDSLNIYESYNRKKTWWNYSLSTKLNFAIYEFYSVNSHHRDKFPLLIAYLESRFQNLVVYSKRRSYLRYITGKGPRMSGVLNLQSGFISLDMFDDSFISFQNGHKSFGRVEVGLQFDDEILERVEANFRNGKHPVINPNENDNKENLLKVNFFTIWFNK